MENLDTQNQTNIDTAEEKNFDPPSSENKKEGKNNKYLIIISLLLFFGIIILGYSYYFKKTPERIIEQSIVSLLNINSLEYEGEIKIDIWRPDLMENNENIPGFQIEEPFYFLLKSEGKFNTENMENYKGGFLFEIETDALKEQLQKEISLSLETKIVDKNAYFRIIKVPDLGLINLEPLSMQWIRFELDDSKWELIEEPSEEELENIKISLTEADIIRPIGNLKREKINETDCYHLNFVFNREGLEKLYFDIVEIRGERLTQYEISSLEERLKNIENVKGELWIEKESYLPIKISLSSEIKGNAKNDVIGSFKSDLLLKNYNREIDIEAPKESKKIEEFLNQIFGGFLPFSY